MSDFLKGAKLGKNSSNSSVPHRARVIDNNDPLGLGRVKVSVQSLEEGFNTDECDWIYTISSSKVGKNPLSFDFLEIPEIGSEVEIRYPYGEGTQPFAYVTNNNNMNIAKGVFAEDYPESFGTIDKVKLVLVNKKKNEYTVFFDNASNLLHISSDGSVYLNIPKDFIIKVGGKAMFQLNSLGLKIDGDYGLKVSGSREADIGSKDGVKAGTSISHDAPKVSHNSGDIVGIVSGIVSGVDSSISAMTVILNKFKKLFASAKVLKIANIGRIGRE